MIDLNPGRTWIIQPGADQWRAANILTVQRSASGWFHADFSRMLGPRATLVGVPSIIETNGLTPTFDKKVVEGDKRTVGFTTADLLPDTDYRFKITVGDTDGQQHSAICILSSRQ